jgi:hypothetical protein
VKNFHKKKLFFRASFYFKSRISLDQKWKEGVSLPEIETSLGEASA